MANTQNPYPNPVYTPPQGQYQWVPNITPTGNATTFGYETLSLVRGKFFNATTVPGGNASVSFAGKLISPVNSEQWPILAAFRPLVDPAHAIGATPTAPMVLANDNTDSSNSKPFSWTFKLNSSNGPTSSFFIDYVLTVDINDVSFLELLTDADKIEVENYIKSLSNGQTAQPPNVNWNNYVLGQVYINGDASHEFPSQVDNKPVELKLTDFQHKGVLNGLQTTISFGVGPLPSSYTHTATSVTIANRYNIPSLQLTLNKVMYFNAQSVNIRDEQLPAALLQYAYAVNFNYDPVQGGDIWPVDSNPTQPNLHIKVFHPDSSIQSPGFAHSIVLRFIVFSTPIYGISPGDSSSLAGVLNGIDTVNAYMAVFIGPVIGSRSAQYAFNLSPISGSIKRRVVPLDLTKIPDAIDKIILQKAEGGNGQTTPDQSANWTTLTEYTPSKPPDFASNGPFVSSYLFLDTNAVFDDWYRTIQVLQNGAQVINGSFRNQPFTEGTVYTLSDSYEPSLQNTIQTMARRILFEGDYPQKNPLDAVLPMAMFATDGDITLPDNLNFQAGSWNMNISAANDDQSGLTTSYIFARIWFVPADQPFDLSNPHQYRQTTEIYFDDKTTPGQTNIVQGTPTSLDQLLVTPPLPSELTYIQLTKYVDGFKGNGLNLPFQNGSRMVVGLYQVSYDTGQGVFSGLDSNTVNLPKTYFQIDSNYSSFQTTITQASTGNIYPQHAPRFTSASYIPVDPYVLTTNTVAGAPLSTDGSVFVPYTGQFASNVNNTATSNTALNGLAVLEKTTASGATAGQVCIPYTKYSLLKDASVPFFADFATNDASLGNGRVEAGTWEIDVDFDKDLDTTSIGNQYRFEAFIVTTNGTVSMRIFNSGVLTPASDDTFSYSVNLDIPFLIDGANNQLILRMTIYPYSRTGKVVDLNSLASKMNKKPVGVRIKSLQISKHTLSVLSLGQVSSNVGSAAFYEDLPLVPNASLDSQQFYYEADSTNEVITIIFGDIGGINNTGGWAISGVLYSPTWFVSLPKGMEVQVADAGLNQTNPNELYFRTVLGQEASQTTELSVSSAEENLTGTVHVAHDIPNTGVTAQDLSNSDRIIKQYKSSSVYSTPDIANVSGFNSGTDTLLNGRNPAITFIPGGPTNDPMPHLALVTQNTQDDPNQTTYNASLNPSAGDFSSWIGPNRDLGDTSFNSPRLLSRGLNSPAFAQTSDNSIVYVAGWISPGAVGYKEVNVFDASRNGTIPEGVTYIVDGVKPDVTDNIVVPDDNFLNGSVNQTFPGIVVNDYGHIMVAYSLTGKDGILYARSVFSGNTLSKAYVIASLLGQNGSSKSLTIYAPSLAWHRSTQIGYFAFWCAGKIFCGILSGGMNDQGYLLSPVQFVAGSGDFTSNTNPANSYFDSLVSTGQIRQDSSSVKEDDVPRQRVGLFVSEKWPTQGSLIIHYFNQKNQLVLRQVQYGGVVGSPVILSS